MTSRLAIVLVTAICCNACSSTTKPPASTPVESQEATAPPQDPEAGEDRLVAWGFEQGKKAIREQRWTDAVQYFTGVVDRRPDHAWANHYLAVSLEQAGDKTRAIGKYRKAFELDPRVSDAAVNLSALLLEQERYDEAEEILRQAIKQVPSDARLHVNLGVALTRLKKDDAAREAYGVALNLAKGLKLRLQIASLLAEGGDPRRARDVYMEAVASEQATADLLLQAAAGLEAMGAHDGCVKACDEALRKEKSAAALVQRSSCRVARGDASGATKDLEDALVLDARNAPAHFYLAELHMASGRKKQAREAYELCCKLAPDSPLAEKAKQRLREAGKQTARR